MKTEAPKKQRPIPHKWNRRKDAQKCCECERDFKIGDMVYDVGVMLIHEGCVAAYVKTMKELGLTP